MKQKHINISLLAGVALILLIPLFLYSNAEFEGADGNAKQVIHKIDPDFSPWFEHIWQPPGGEIETLLFSLQAATGAGILFFILGYLKGKRDAARQNKAQNPSSH